MVRVSIFMVALASCLSTVLSHPANGPRNTQFGCGTEPSAEFLAKAQELAGVEALEVKSNLSITSRTLSPRAATLKIKTYFNVVAKSTAPSDGWISSTILKQQLAVMNSDYAKHGIEFVLAGQRWVVNKNWATDRSYSLTMKKALRKGDYKALNIYFVYALDGNLGLCNYPSTVTTGSDNFYLDGCSILYNTTPGGNLVNYNLGKTVTHEVGHWFGLMHTFQGGCTGTGDSIADTPASASASSGCPTGRKSCSNVAGVDPIHNYMDYSYDTCYTGFTANQKTRMHSMYDAYRA